MLIVKQSPQLELSTARYFCGVIFNTRIERTFHGDFPCRYNIYWGFLWQLTGPEYDAFVEEFIEAAVDKYGKSVMLQVKTIVMFRNIRTPRL